MTDKDKGRNGESNENFMNNILAYWSELSFPSFLIILTNRTSSLFVYGFLEYKISLVNGYIYNKNNRCIKDNDNNLN